MRLSDEQREALYAAAEDRLELANRLIPVLVVDGVPYEGTIESVEGSDSEPAVVFSGILPVNPRTGAECRIDFTILPPVESGAKAVTLTGYRGKITHKATRGGITGAEAETPAYRWQRTPLRTNSEWLNTPVNVVLFSAFSGLYREYAGMDFHITEPAITAQGSERLGAWDMISDAVDLAEGETMRVVDTARSQVGMYALGPPSETETVWNVEEGVDSPEVEAATIDEERYHSVAVVRTLEDGEQELLAEVKVDNGEAYVPEGDVFVIEYTSEDEEAKRSAYNMAFLEASRRGRNARKLTVPLVYWPFWIDRGELVSVTTRTYVLEGPAGTVIEGMPGSVRERYVMRVDGFSWGESRMEAALTGEAMWVGVEYHALSSGLDFAEGSSVARATWGVDFAGAEFFSTELPWVRYIPDDGAVELDPDIAAEYGVSIEVEGNEVVVSG